MAIEDGFAVTETPKDLKATESLAEGDKYLVQNTSVFRVFYIEVAAVDKATQKPQTLYRGTSVIYTVGSDPAWFWTEDGKSVTLAIAATA